MAIDLMYPTLPLGSRINDKSTIFLNPKLYKYKNIQDLSQGLMELYNYSPYPGDLDLGSYAWITDTAINLHEYYNPDFIFLSYANPYYVSLHTPPQELFWEEHLTELFAQVERFLFNTEYIPIIIGTGGTYPLENEIDLSYLEDKVDYVWPSRIYTSLYNLGPKDMKLLEKDKAIQMIISAERLQAISEEPREVLPDHFLIARRGYAFSSPEDENIYRINGRDANIPIIAPQSISNISQIHRLVRSLLSKRKKVALIILEGISTTDFKWEHQVCSNTYSWFTYLPEEFQYLTIGTGAKFSNLKVFSKFQPDGNSFEQSLKRAGLEKRAIGKKSNIKSVAVGSRRDLTRIASGADITIECGY